MPSQPIGIYAEQVAKRESAVSRLSPAARHAAFPKLYARPLPMPTEAAKLREEIAKLQVQLNKAKRDNDKLCETVAALRTRINTPSDVLLQRLAQRRNSPQDVVAVYLSELNRLRVEAGGAEYTRDHLCSPRRSRELAAPRHVCIWLVRTLCMHYSLPMIGKLMGGRDHTTIMCATQRADHWLLIDPVLKAAADATLLRFGTKP